jgi:hypothetical protein
MASGDLDVRRRRGPGARPELMVLRRLSVSKGRFHKIPAQEFQLIANHRARTIPRNQRNWKHRTTSATGCAGSTVTFSGSAGRVRAMPGGVSTSGV